MRKLLGLGLVLFSYSLHGQNPINRSGGGNSGTGTFVTLSGDATSTSTGGATVVNGLHGVPFCNGFTPTNGQFVEYSTALTPNPCYTAAAASSYTLPTDSGNKVIATPSNGSSGVSALRALVSLDIPNNAANTSGKAATAGNADTVTNGMTQAVANSAANTVSVSVGTSGTAFAKTPDTIDPSTGAFSTPSTISSGVGGSVAGSDGLGSGTPTSAPTGFVGFQAPASVTTPYFMNLPVLPLTGFLFNTGTTDPSVITFVPTIPAANMAATPVSIAATTHTMTAPREYFLCTTATACSVTLPVPAASYEFCVRSDNNVSTAITLAARTSILYEKTDRTGWGTAGNSISSGAAVTNQICVIGYDATHYAIMSSAGTWTNN